MSTFVLFDMIHGYVREQLGTEGSIFTHDPQQAHRFEEDTAAREAIATYKLRYAEIHLLCDDGHVLFGRGSLGRAATEYSLLCVEGGGLDQAWTVALRVLLENAFLAGGIEASRPPHASAVDRSVMTVAERGEWIGHGARRQSGDRELC